MPQLTSRNWDTTWPRA